MSRSSLVAMKALLRPHSNRREGEIEVAGSAVAHSLTDLGLIDEYRIYLHPVVLGHGKPYFRRAPSAAPPCCE